MATILCIDDEPIVLSMLRRTLDGAGHSVIGTGDAASALEVLRTEAVDLILSDYRMPGVTGLDLLYQLRESGSAIPLVMLTAYSNVEHAVLAMKSGAADYLAKPIRSDQLTLVVNQVLESYRLRRQTAQLAERVALQRPDRSIVGESSPLKEIIASMESVAPTRATILLTGESGTGKELLARGVHELSERATQPFIAINCAAMPESLVESTLFGHERGAFTGAIKQSKGVFERAHRGTLLLDEVSEMRLDLQAKLLRVLQEQEFERVGGNTPVRVDTRVIATTNRDLRSEVRDGRFREDLFYRLSVVQIRVPPLRERVEDVPLLVQHFLKRAARESGRDVTGVTPEAMQRLCEHAWPGNVRELSHAIERAVILSTGPLIGPEAFDLPTHRAVPPSLPAAAVESSAVVLPSLRIADAERLLIDSALQATGQNRTRAASLLGISVRTLRNKLNRPEEDVEAN